jgi:hypothetical protein
MNLARAVTKKARGCSLRGALAAGAVFLSAIAASAQTDQPAPATETPKRAETVVVTGHRSQQDVDTIVSQFVDQHAAPNRKTGQYMRDDIGPVCPVTLGLPGAFDAFVTARVVQVAVAVGASTDKTGTCKPNVEIIFTDEPSAVVKSLAERTKGGILGMHYMHETPRLLEVTHPIQGWYVTGTRMDSNAIAPITSTDRSGSTTPADDKTPKLDNAYRNVPERVSLGSKIPGRRISSIVNVLIVADIKQVGGGAIGPVADYIAMLALSEPLSLDQCNALPSILDMMSANCGSRPKPDRLTDSDIAYLKGLYAADLGATTNSRQQESIKNGMEDHLGESSKPDTKAPDNSN